MNDKPKVTEDRDVLLRRIGARILRRRQELGLSQTDVARLLGIGSANIHRIEQGSRNLTIDTLCKVAEVLDMTVAELVTGTPPAPSA